MHWVLRTASSTQAYRGLVRRLFRGGELVGTYMAPAPVLLVAIVAFYVADVRHAFGEYRRFRERGW